MALLINTKFGEVITSESLNNKFNTLMGGNVILEGFDVFAKDNVLQINPGRCVITGASIEDTEINTVNIDPEFLNKEEILVVFIYNHKEFTFETKIKSKDDLIKENELVIATIKLGNGEIIEITNIEKTATLKDINKIEKLLSSNLLETQYIEYEGENITCADSYQAKTDCMSIIGNSKKESNNIFSIGSEGNSFKLISTGKNLLNTDNLIGCTYQDATPRLKVDYENITSNTFIADTDTRGVGFVLRVSSNTKYTLKMIESIPNLTLAMATYETLEDCYNSNRHLNKVMFINTSNNEISITTPQNCNYIVCGIFVTYNYISTNKNLEFEIPLMQLEEGDGSNIEPYKEDVVTIALPIDGGLKGLPSGICDEITSNGDVIQRVGRVIFDGSEDWNIFKNENYLVFYLLFEDTTSDNNQEVLSNLFPSYGFNQNVENIYCDNKMVYLVTTKEKIQGDSIEAFKLWLSNNNVEMLFEIDHSGDVRVEDFSIRTFNGTTNITTKNIPPAILNINNMEGENVSLNTLAGVVDVEIKGNTIGGRRNKNIVHDSKNLYTFKNKTYISSNNTLAPIIKTGVAVKDEFGNVSYKRFESDEKISVNNSINENTIDFNIKGRTLLNHFGLDNIVLSSDAHRVDNLTVKAGVGYTYIFRIKDYQGESINDLGGYIFEAIYEDDTNMRIWDCTSLNGGWNNNKGLFKVFCTHEKNVKQFVSWNRSQKGSIEIDNMMILEGNWINKEIPKSFENFKSPGVEKDLNLWDGTTINYFIEGQTATVKAHANTRSAIFRCKGNKTYTIYKSKGNRFAIGLSDNQIEIDSVVNNIFYSYENKPYTFKTEPRTEYIIIYLDNEGTNDFDLVIKEETNSLIPSKNEISILSTGKNLFDGEYIKGSKFENNGTITHNENSRGCVISKNFIKVYPSKSYTLSSNKSFNAYLVAEYDIDYKFISRRDISLDINKTLSDNCYYIKVYCYSSNVNLDLSGLIIQFEEGNSKTQYEPYKQDKRIINLPFNDGLKSISNTIYDEIKENKVIKKVEKYVFTGDEEFKLWSGTPDNSEFAYFIVDNVLPNKKLKSNKGISNKFKIIDVAMTDEEMMALRSTGDYDRVYISVNKNKADTLDNFINLLKQWNNNGSPLIVYYEINEPIEYDLSDNITSEVIVYESEFNCFDEITSVGEDINNNIILFSEGNNLSHHKNISLSENSLKSLPNGIRDILSKENGLDKKVEKIIFNGSEDWNHYITLGDFEVFYTDLNKAISSSQVLLCDRFPANGWYSEVGENIYVDNKRVYLSISITRINSNDSSSLKSWLSENNTTILFEYDKDEALRVENYNINTFDGITNIESKNNISPIVEINNTETNIDKNIIKLNSEQGKTELISVKGVTVGGIKKDNATSLKNNIVVFEGETKLTSNNNIQPDFYIEYKKNDALYAKSGNNLVLKSSQNYEIENLVVKGKTALNVVVNYRTPIISSSELSASCIIDTLMKTDTEYTIIFINGDFIAGSYISDLDRTFTVYNDKLGKTSICFRTPEDDLSEIKLGLYPKSSPLLQSDLNNLRVMIVEGNWENKGIYQEFREISFAGGSNVPVNISSISGDKEDRKSIQIPFNGLKSLPSGTADEIHLGSNYIIQKVGEMEFNGNEGWVQETWSYDDTVSRFSLVVNEITKETDVIFTKFKHDRTPTHNPNSNTDFSSSICYSRSDMKIYVFPDKSIRTLQEWKDYLYQEKRNRRPLKVFYQLENPIIHEINNITVEKEFINYEKINSSCDEENKIIIASKNKNLFNFKEFITEGNKEYYRLGYDGIEILKNDNRKIFLSSEYKIKINKNTNYVLSTSNSNEVEVYLSSDGNKFTLAECENFVFNSGDNIFASFKFIGNSNFPIVIRNIQLEEGDVSTDHIDYREGIQAINIPFNGGLKSLPNGSCDLINNSEVIKNVDTITFNGNEDWKIDGFIDNLSIFYLEFNKTTSESIQRLYCDRFPSFGPSENYKENIYCSNKRVYIIIDSNKLSENNVAGFKSWLNKNNTSIYFKLDKTESERVENLNINTLNGTTKIETKNKVKPEISFTYNNKEYNGSSINIESLEGTTENIKIYGRTYKNIAKVKRSWILNSTKKISYMVLYGDSFKRNTTYTVFMIGDLSKLSNEFVTIDSDNKRIGSSLSPVYLIRTDDHDYDEYTILPHVYPKEGTLDYDYVSSIRVLILEGDFTKNPNVINNIYKENSNLINKEDNYSAGDSECTLTNIDNGSKVEASTNGSMVICYRTNKIKRGNKYIILFNIKANINNNEEYSCGISLRTLNSFSHRLIKFKIENETLTRKSIVLDVPEDTADISALVIGKHNNVTAGDYYEITDLEVYEITEYQSYFKGVVSSLEDEKLDLRVNSHNLFNYKEAFNNFKNTLGVSIFGNAIKFNARINSSIAKQFNDAVLKEGGFKNNTVYSIIFADTSESTFRFDPYFLYTDGSKTIGVTSGVGGKYIVTSEEGKTVKSVRLAWNNSRIGYTVLYDIQIIEGSETKEYINYIDNSKKYINIPDGGLKSLPSGVCDYIDENGQLNKLVGDIILTGEENWKLEYIDQDLIKFSMDLKETTSDYNQEVLADNYNSYGFRNDVENIYCNNKKIIFIIKKNKLTSSDIDGLKKFLQKNNIKVLYEIDKTNSDRVENYNPIVFDGINHISIADDCNTEIILSVETTNGIVEFTGNNILINNGVSGIAKNITLKGKTIIDSGEIKSVCNNRKLNIITTGKNLFNKWIENKSIDLTNGEIISSEGNSVSDFIKVKPDTNYVFNKNSNFALYDLNKEFISYSEYTAGNVILINTNAYYIRFTKDSSNLSKAQFEEGIILTSFEDYKYEIKSIDVPFSGGFKSLPNGIYDELTSSKITQNVGYALLNGLENWELEGKNKNLLIFSLMLNETTVNQSQSVLCDKFTSYGYDITKENIYCDNKKLYIVIDVSRLSEETIFGFKTWLSVNNTKVLFELDKSKTIRVNNYIPQVYKDKTNIVINDLNTEIKINNNSIEDNILSMNGDELIESICIKGKTQQNIFNIDLSNATWVKGSYYAHLPIGAIDKIFKPNTKYSIYVHHNYGAEITFKVGHPNNYLTNQVEGKTKEILTFTTNNRCNEGTTLCLLINENDFNSDRFLSDVKVVIVEGELNLEQMFDGIKSLGEENNKIELYSTDKNLVRSNDIKLAYIGGSYRNQYIEEPNGLNRIAIIRCKPNTEYTISKTFATDRFKICTSSKKVNNMDTFDNIINVNTEEKTYIYRTNETAKYLIVYYNRDVNEFRCNIQIEEGNLLTSYKESNFNNKIIKIPFNGGLKSLPNGVCDEFNSCNNTITQKVGKVKLTGKENWIFHSTNEKSCIAILEDEIFKPVNVNSLAIYCDNLKTVKQNSADIEEYKNIYGNHISSRIESKQGIYVFLDKNMLTSTDLTGIKNWFKENPTTVYFELNNHIIHSLDNQ